MHSHLYKSSGVSESHQPSRLKDSKKRRKGELGRIYVNLVHTRKATDSSPLLPPMMILMFVLLVLPFSPIYCIGFVSALTTSITVTAKNLSPPRKFIESSRHSRNSFYQTRATADDDAAVATSNFWTLQELEDYAASDTIGVVISFTTFGPGYRAVARAKHDESIVLGYVEGFLRPTQPELLHVDKMEIFQPKLERVRRARPGTLNFGRVSIGLGLLLGYRCLLHATTEEESKGRKPRTVAEFLAIDDADFQHKRLVRYYRYAGFKVVKYVGEDFGSIPDRLVWGGCGTLMKQDIPVLKNKWVSLLELMKTRVEKDKNEVNSKDNK